ncbi:MAG: class I SAM-dependent methyltransferase, partial [bacterium]|nr:class I SAM-dependent methyltransferase [bacterium]
MKDKIELFSEKLIDENKDLALEVLGYAQKFGKSQGWHYVLDMIWVLKELENKKGGTILAAGAGLGLLQFILAARGYRMVSVDVNQRKKPVFIENIYHVQYMGTEADITHPFLEWHQLKREGGKATQNEAENPSGLPTIIFYHADLHNMELLKDNSIDAVVSISALEHNPPEKLEGVVSELGRVLKHNGKMYLTVSTAKEDFFH